MKRKLLCSTCRIRLLVLLLVFIYPPLFLPSKAQAVSLADQVIEISFKDKEIEKVFREIEAKTNFTFTYSPSDLVHVPRITLGKEKRTVVKLMKEISAKSHLNFNISNNQISVSLNKEHQKNMVSNKPVVTQTKVADTTITGLVTDTLKIPLAGVHVFIKDKPSIGTSTDVNGRYIIKVPLNTVLVFSYVGFENQEVTARKNIIDITLKEDASLLGEVVVVGFGTQKKESVVSAITTINPNDLKIPSSNLTTALAGRAAGVVSYQRSGEPGADNAEFFIRGVTTFGYKVDPLILIDNVEVTTTDLARLIPDDIESFSILKDATATAIYGARGANGVILIKTKQGEKGAPKISFRMENSVSEPTSNVELVDPVNYMKLYNEATFTRNPGAQLLYSQAQIDNTVPGADPYLYPQVDWRDALIKDRTSNQRANMSVSGGGEVARYMVSGAFRRDNGLLEVPKENNFNNNIRLNSYNLRSNVDITLGRNTTMLVRLNGSFDDYNGPINGGTDIYNAVVRTPPTAFAPFYPKTSKEKFLQHILFGMKNNNDLFAYINPYAELARGYKDYARSKMLAQVELMQGLDFITKGLKFRGLVNTSRYAFIEVTRSYKPFYYQFEGINPLTNEYSYSVLNAGNDNEDPRYVDGTEYLDYKAGERDIKTLLYLESALNYDTKIGENHNLSAMTVFIMRDELKGAVTTLQESLPFRNIGLSGRFTYAYSDRYFTEFNFGYNGSERFHRDQRFGFFPSVGAGWNISNESFWEPMSKMISKLKVRGSYGIVGNDAIGSDRNRFQYLSEVDLTDGSRGYTFGEGEGRNSKPGISFDRYSNPAITWEKGYKSNIGIELGLFNKADFIIDIFRENRKNIFMRRNDIPTTLGLAAPIYANIGEALSRGVDVQFNYNHSFHKDLWLQMMGNFTYATSEYLKVEEPDYVEPWLSQVGYSLKQQWGYLAERLFIDDEEVVNSPQQIFGDQAVRGGDIKYKDVNGDGKISSLDRVPIGYPTTPEIIYGAGFSTGYKGFDFSVFFQGSARSSFWIDPYITAPFTTTFNDQGKLIGIENQILKAYGDSHWSEENRDLYAIWPRLSTQHVQNNEQRSTWFMRNGNFLRLKQAEFGYNLPDKLSSKLKMRSMRVYLNGTNLFVLSKFKLWDVEMAGNGLDYPLQRVYNIGLSANF